MYYSSSLSPPQYTLPAHNNTAQFLFLSSNTNLSHNQNCPLQQLYGFAVAYPCFMLSFATSIDSFHWHATPWKINFNTRWWKYLYLFWQTISLFLAINSLFSLLVRCNFLFKDEVLEEVSRVGYVAMDECYNEQFLSIKQDATTNTEVNCL
jgi:hypothetical protein